MNIDDILAKHKGIIDIYSIETGGIALARHIALSAKGRGNILLLDPHNNYAITFIDEMFDPERAAILCDDVIDDGSTLFNSAAHLMQQGYSRDKIYAYILSSELDMSFRPTLEHIDFFVNYIKEIFKERPEYLNIPAELT